MNDLELFTFEGNKVPVKLVGEQLMFDAATVAKSVGISRVAKSGNAVVRWERVNKYLNACPEVGTGDFITEQQMYKLAIKANNPTAERFQDWVTGEVLPSIRKNGAYLTDRKAYDVTHNKDALADLLVQAGNQLKEKELQITEMKPKADYFDDLVDRNLLTNFRDTAKELHIKQKVFIDWLLKHKYVYRDKRGQLKHYSRYDNDLFEFREFASEWTEKAHLQTLITPKGRATFKLLIEQQQTA